MKSNKKAPEVNAIWISRMSDYKQTENCFSSAQVIMNIKNMRREVMLDKHGILLPHIRIINQNLANNILLAEGRAARLFWKNFSSLLPSWCCFKSRIPGSKDMANHLLDIGYHHLTGIVKSIIEKYHISAALGVLHTARKTNSAPLAYDLVEMFRADIVETETLKFLRMKKRPLATISQRDISVFLFRINRRLEYAHFLREVKQCRPYRYYMEMQILKFIKAVNHKGIFYPIYLPLRHDGRCR